MCVCVCVCVCDFFAHYCIRTFFVVDKMQLQLHLLMMCD